MELFNNAQRLMSNYYARLYYNRLTYRFKQWKQNMINMKHREFLMKKFIDHARGNKWYMVKAAFQTWLSKIHRKETLIAIRKTKIEADEVEHMNQHRMNLFNELKTGLEQEIAINDADAQLQGSRAAYLLSAIIRKNDVNYYTSNKRHIFRVWVDYIHRQKRFVIAINNVLLKSCLQQGFSNINAFSRDKALCRGQRHALSYFRRLFFKYQVGGSFSKWRTYRLDA